MVRQKRQLDLSVEEGMVKLVKFIKKPEPPTGDAQPLAFIMKNQDQDLLAHIAIPPPHADTEELTPKDYQIKEIMLGRPMVDTAKAMIITGIKEVFIHMDKDESKLLLLRKQNEFLRGYLHGVVGLIDLDNLEIALVAALETKEKGSVQLDSFLGMSAMV